jgi:hypothetical protein
MAGVPLCTAAFSGSACLRRVIKAALLLLPRKSADFKALLKLPETRYPAQLFINGCAN